jgi:uncharacterized membrane protein YccF (DUF307 family)
MILYRNTSTIRLNMANIKINKISSFQFGKEKIHNKNIYKYTNKDMTDKAVGHRIIIKWII